MNCNVKQNGCKNKKGKTGFGGGGGGRETKPCSIAKIIQRTNHIWAVNPRAPGYNAVNLNRLYSGCQQEK
jgi:hypothetical protein